jgi:hypothetical protein
MTMRPSKGVESESGHEPRVVLPPIADTVVTEREIRYTVKFPAKGGRGSLLQSGRTPASSARLSIAGPTSPIKPAAQKARVTEVVLPPMDRAAPARQSTLIHSASAPLLKSPRGGEGDEEEVAVQPGLRRHDTIVSGSDGSPANVKRFLRPSLSLADLREKPAIRRRLQKQPLHDFFDSTGQRRYQDLSLSVWTQAAVRKGEERMLVLQNSLSTLAQQTNSDNALEKDREARRKLVLEKYPVGFVDKEVQKAKHDMVFENFDGAEKKYLLPGFSLSALDTPREGAETKQAKQRLAEEAGSEVLSDSMSPSAASPPRHTSTLDTPIINEETAGVYAFSDGQGKKLQPLLKRYAGRSAWNCVEGVFERQVQRVTFVRAFWSLRFFDKEYVPYHWALGRLYDPLAVPLHRKGFAKGTVAAMAVDDFWTALDHLCRQRFGEVDASKELTAYID